MGSWKPSMVEAAGLCGRVRRSVTNVWEDMHGLGSQAPVLVLLPFVSERPLLPPLLGEAGTPGTRPPILITVPLISLQLGHSETAFCFASCPQCLASYRCLLSLFPAPGLT